MSVSVPTYRRKKTPTIDYALVTLPDGAGKRRDVVLGRYGTPESRQEYLRVIAEWEANGRRLAQAVGSNLSVNELAIAYWLDAEKRQASRPRTCPGELESLRSALRPLKELYGHTPAAKFGPLALKAVRERMVDSKTPAGKPWSRGFVNACVSRVKRVFKWGVANEILPPAVFHGLQTVTGLQRGQTRAREAEEVKPVPLAFVEATLPHAPAPVAAMVRLQLLTAMRPGEVVIMRACDINMTGRIWFYAPQFFKTQWRGHSRAIAIGPKAQEIVKQFFTTDLTAYLFSPRAAMDDRRRTLRANRKSKVQPSQVDRRKKAPRKAPRDRYDVGSYRQAIHAAAVKADVPEWSPNQLRHTSATELRKEFGLDAARAILGHRSTRVTEVYAEIDAKKATTIMQRIG
jgi:integrase